MPSFTVDPVRKFETTSGVCIVLTTRGTVAVGNNSALVVGVTGQRIRIMGWVIQSDGAVIGTFTLKSASGGSTITTPLTAPASTTGAVFHLPLVDSGYMETSTGHGLFVDVATAQMMFNISYIIYTP